MLLPADLEQGAVVLDLEQFFWRYSIYLLYWYTSTNTGAFFSHFFVCARCPLDESLTSLRWGTKVRGDLQKKKPALVLADKTKTGNKVNF